MSFEKVKAHIIENIGVPVTLDGWTALSVRVTQDTAKTIRVLYVFQLDKFEVEQELKFTSELSSSVENYEEEINRQLNQLDGYTEALVKIEELIKESEHEKLSDEGSWKARVVALDRHNPLHSTATVVFSRMNEQNELLSFYKKFDLLQNSFVSYALYTQELHNIVENLQAAQEAPTGYFEQLIHTTTY